MSSFIQSDCYEHQSTLRCRHGVISSSFKVNNNALRRIVVPNLFLTVAHFYFENFPWPYSQSIAQELDQIFISLELD